MTAAPAWPTSQRPVWIVQGEQMISGDPETVLATVLGSCIAVCLFDASRQIGGMNHFLLPAGEGAAKDDMKYGAHSMELLINGLLRQGAKRGNMVAKVFGGARMTGRFADIGARNGAFALQFLKDEAISVVAQDIGGTDARNVRFHPVSGRARSMLAKDKVREVVPVVLDAPKGLVTLF